jgi:hypothetical protein
MADKEISMNRTRMLWLAAVSGAAVCLLLFGVLLRHPAPNLIQNGDFESGLDKWWWYVDPKSGAEALFTTESVPGAHGAALRVSVDKAAELDNIEISQGHVVTKAGQNYTLTFRARSTVAQEIEIKLIKNADPWTSYGFLRTAHITTRWQTQQLVGRASMTADDGKLMFHFNTPDSKIWIDDIRFQERRGLF